MDGLSLADPDRIGYYGVRAVLQHHAALLAGLQGVDAPHTRSAPQHKALCRDGAARKRKRKAAHESRRRNRGR